jgi:hypothetical protein
MTEVHPTQKAVEEAIDRLARTPDGAMLYVYLQRRLMEVIPTADQSALSAHHGERIFASRLTGLMAKGIIESGGRTGITGSSTGPGGLEQPIVRPVAKSVTLGGPRGAGRRITEHTRVPGYDPPDDAA